VVVPSTLVHQKDGDASERAYITLPEHLTHSEESKREYRDRIKTNERLSKDLDKKSDNRNIHTAPASKQESKQNSHV
jgi:hypothetical protein